MIAKLMKNKLVSSLLDRRTLLQFGKYVITGVIAAGTEFSALVLLTEYAKLWYILSNSIAYAGGFWISFLLNKYWSFNSRDHFGRQLAMYGLLFLINLGLSTALMYLLTSVLGLFYTISKLLVMGLIVLWNFAIYKKIIYRS
jgi:putative flippase GtrA